jgi:hypothetical protein
MFNFEKTSYNLAIALKGRSAYGWSIINRSISHANESDDYPNESAKYGAAFDH